MKEGAFRSTQWDPYLLITQIFAIQSILYATLALCLFLMDSVSGSGETNTLDRLFRYHEIHMSNSGSRIVVCSFLLNSFIGAVALWFIVKRAKLCLDFSCTFHIIHLIVCWWYNSIFPTTISWWLLNAICCTLMCVGGEFLCLKTELKEIPVGYSALNQKSEV